MLNASDLRVWLCDLTYTQQTIAADTMPLGVACIATYTDRQLGLKHPVRVFKYPEKLAEALANEPYPHVIGFSNYCWNTRLGQLFAQLLRRRFPDIVIVCGGPHYPVDAAEQAAYLAARPEIDFYVAKEGEKAFAGLIAALLENDFDLARVKSLCLPSLHYLGADGAAVLSPMIDRIMDLDEIPSPYVSGKMDEFFDGKVMPLLQTNRGCPFSCTFCVEGVQYYNKIKKYSGERVAADIEYIGRRMFETRDPGSRYDLFIADSNFAMYAEDIDTCKALRATREQYGWPEYINVATGKNNKERVIEAATLLDGALRLSGSVQSLSGDVLEKIKRKNISAEDLIKLGLHAKDVGVNSYSEIILGLPGDSKQAHFDTIRGVMDAGFNFILPWQLMLLPGSEMGSAEHKRQYAMDVRYRVLPRCFGNYEVLGERIVCAEIEEVCVANSTLSYEDYLECRKLNLLVAIFYNDGAFSTILTVLRMQGVAPFELFLEMMQQPFPEGMQAVFDAFIDATKKELWDSRESLEVFVAEPANNLRYVEGELGRNNLYFFRTLAILRYTTDLRNVTAKAMEKVLRTAGCWNTEMQSFLADALDYHWARINGLFDGAESSVELTQNYDIARFESAEVPQGLSAYQFVQPQRIAFHLSESQQKLIDRYKNVMGDSDVAIARILSRVYVKKLLRIPEMLP